MCNHGVRFTLAIAFLLSAACGDSGNTPGPGTGAGGGGAGGTTSSDGGLHPYVVSPVNAPKISKVDLLFLIDNSSSMADKQSLLAKAVPSLVDRLIDPPCVDPVTGRPTGLAVNGVCAFGVRPFEPVNDIHVGILTSSLGPHGAQGVCSDSVDTSLGRSDPHNDDRGHLIARGVGGTTVATFNDKGFLFYNPAVSGALASAAAIAAPFTSLIQGVGQHGCGYEAPLESVYRFLVDPEPFDKISIVADSSFGQASLEGTDTALLQQRSDFLRPDSLVSIAIVTDENDCSVIDGGNGFWSLLPPLSGLGKSALARGTSACLTNPNDACCFNCDIGTAPPGCPTAASDPECAKGQLPVVEDQPNLRCFNQKKRYGVDMLYPVQRYIDGFTLPTIQNRRGEQVPNPLFSDLTCKSGAGCAGTRGPALVYVAGLVGVPWQDIAVDPNDLSKGYKTASQLDSGGVWADIVGDPQHASGPILPKDTHMVESILPRVGLPGPSSAPGADAINGHEWDPSKDTSQPSADLQYACIFDLVPSKTCATFSDCDCFGPDLNNMKNPLCQTAQGTYSTTQLHGKAYPGTRILQVLQGLGDQAVVGSICAAQSTDATRDDFGYMPFVDGLVGQLGKPLRHYCFTDALPVDATTSQTPCNLIEVFGSDPSACACDNEAGRRTAPDAILTDEMKAKGSCRCEIKQLGGADQRLCQTSVNPPTTSGSAGWCYVDPGQTKSQESCVVVRDCPADDKRLVKIINADPRPGSTTYLRCDTHPIAPAASICP